MLKEAKNGSQEVKLNWAKGMVGCIPVFSSRELAEEYAGDCEVCEIITKTDLLSIRTATPEKDEDDDYLGHHNFRGWS